MNDQVKRKALIFLVIAGILTLLIAAGLPQLRLQPGVPLPGPTGQSGVSPTPKEPVVTVSVSMLFKTILAVVLTFGVLYISYLILRKVSLKQILLRFLYFAILTAIGCVALILLGDLNFSFQPGAPQVLPTEVASGGPPLSAVSPDLVWVVWIVLAAIFLLLVVWLVLWALRWRRRPDDRLALEAERALQALKLNQDFKNVILQCYWQMSQALRHEQGIVLEETMTAREFEHLAEAKGIPHAPVHQLTQLFEIVRYGYRQPDPAEEQKAIECLQAIVAHSRAKKQAI
jgi:hypothetical protein